MGGRRDVVRVRHVHGNAVVRRHPVSSGAGSAEPHLLLYCEDEVQVIFRVLQALHRHQQHRAGDPVIQIGREDAPAGAKSGRVIDRDISHLHHGPGLRLIPGPNVQVQVFQLHILGFHLALQGHHAAGTVGEADGSAQHLVGGEPAHRAEAEEALLVNIGDH